MNYKKIKKAIFHRRLNRFVAEVYLDEQIEKVHVKNTGRLKELLLPNAEVLLEESDQPNRKTKFSLIAAKKATFGSILIHRRRTPLRMKRYREGKLPKSVISGN